MNEIEGIEGEEMQDWSNILEHLGMEQANLYAKEHRIDPPFDMDLDELNEGPDLGDRHPEEPQDE